MNHLSKVIAISFIFFLSFIVTSGSGYAGDVEKGKEVYQQLCMLCHGVGGHPKYPRVPDFSKGERLEKNRIELINAIKKGFKHKGLGSPSPSMEGNLSDAELEDTIYYINSLYPRDVTRGKKVYEKLCITCHGHLGHSQYFGVPDFSNGERLNKDKSELINAVKKGYKNSSPILPMPPLKDIFSDAELEDVIYYIFSLHTRDVTKGEEVYERSCKACHAAGGHPQYSVVPDFSKGERLEMDKSELINAVKTEHSQSGPTLPMPSLKDIYSDVELEDVLSYILTLKK
jgi:mono/diheme cytochrome c family protein